MAVVIPPQWEISEQFGADMKIALAPLVTTDEQASQVWGALANCDWHHEDGRHFKVTFRRCDDLVSDYVRDGYWYCTARAGTPQPWITDAMAARGWHPEPGPLP